MGVKFRMCPKMRPVGVTKKGKKGQKLSCVKLAICPDHPRRHRPLKFCVRGHVREVVIYFKFHENRSRGLGAVGVENRPLPLTRPMAYTTACTTAHAVINVLPDFWHIIWACGLSASADCSRDSMVHVFFIKFQRHCSIHVAVGTVFFAAMYIIWRFVFRQKNGIRTKKRLRWSTIFCFRVVWRKMQGGRRFFSS